MPRDLDMTKVSPPLQDFVRTVDALLKQRRLESARGTMMPSHWGFHESVVRREWTLTEFTAEFSSYRDIRRGKTRGVPDRRYIEQIAQWLNCSREERIRLLRSVGFAPGDEFLQGAELEEALIPCRRILNYLPIPALILTRDWVVWEWNEFLLKFLGWDNEYMLSIPKKQLNLLQLIFDDKLRLRKQLSVYPGAWEQTAWRNVYGFVLSNPYSMNEVWYQELIEELHELPDFPEYWYRVTNEQVPPYFKSAHVDYITDLSASNGKTLKFNTLIISSGDLNYPQVVAYMPTDRTSRDVYAELGIPVPENAWGFKRPDNTEKA
jgi:PAS domain-containing protein